MLTSTKELLETAQKLPTLLVRSICTISKVLMLLSGRQKLKGEPKLDFERLAKICQQLDISLVLHGASGLPASMIRQSIELSVYKFNVKTEVRQKYLQFWREFSKKDSQSDLLDCQEAATNAMQQVIAEKLRLFGSADKA
ncbi:MAG: class II fructose-bisphosphate aldolase [Cyanobacteria bacterium P01_F01_bin.116]